MSEPTTIENPEIEPEAVEAVEPESVEPAEAVEPDADEPEEEVEASEDEAPEAGPDEAALALSAVIQERDSLRDRVALLEAAIPPEESVTLSVDALNDLKAKAAAGAEALEKIRENEAKARIEMAIREDRITPAQADDPSIIAASRNEDTWKIVLACAPEGATGINTRGPKGGSDAPEVKDPRAALASVAMGICAERGINYGEAIRLAISDNPDLAASAGYNR